jgi:hypothetical protein
MQIKATVIQDSTYNGVRLTTMEWEYPRFIHSEVMTHRMLSKNAASSRAIPVERMHKHIVENTAMPVFWGKNKPGMQAAEEVDNIPESKIAWKIARDDALASAVNLHDRKGLHKQISNRVTEAFQIMKTVVSATEWENLFWLRDHPDAQPEFRVLAEQAKKAMIFSRPEYLMPDQWHVPYVNRVWDGENVTYTSEGQKLTAQEALIVSASCCAQVSYRTLDQSYAKAKLIFDKLVSTNGPVHASPLEHQAYPMVDIRAAIGSMYWEEGVTHMRRDRSLWSGNFRGWVQHRQLIEGNTKW